MTSAPLCLSVYSVFDCGCKLLFVSTAQWITLLKRAEETFQTLGKRDGVSLAISWWFSFASLSVTSLLVYSVKLKTPRSLNF